MISYIRASKQKYWDSLKKVSKDDIMVGDYYHENGCKWEFKIEQVELGTGGKTSAVRVCIFEDAVQALKSSVVRKAILALGKCLTLDEAEVRLIKAGILPDLGKHKHKAVREEQGEGDMTYFCSCGARKYYVYGTLSPIAIRSVKWVPAELVKLLGDHWPCAPWGCSPECGKRVPI